ncbi:MAG TPA: zinc finger domain-containing protein [Planctomycetota bacterium]|nr:zinc finger domain-containing protein [Planctomycetota bacterium]
MGRLDDRSARVLEGRPPQAAAPPHAGRRGRVPSGPLIEILQESGLGIHPRLSALGPDILSPRFDGAEALRRLQLRPDREIGEALLDQEALAGVGNVFKSEALFRRRIHPRRRIRDIRPEEFRALWKELARLMSAGAKVAGSIVTLPRRLRKHDETRWVYRRTGRPCFVCGTRIETLRQGGRDSYFCPRCQR